MKVNISSGAVYPRQRGEHRRVYARDNTVPVYPRQRGEHGCWSNSHPEQFQLIPAEARGTPAVTRALTFVFTVYPR
ncbi:hypothetical protein KCP74_10650 [Salmonella enterica subsp. enterica]|nr:hypothetical protein KCP74_10650 [Salmonella enterica subsp. enterica]